MPRPVSWLPRLPEIRRAVQNSVQSHYQRRDLERLFDLQPRAAGLLLEMLPKVAISGMHLVERESLQVFLKRIALADDVTAELELIRYEKAQTSRKKLRVMVGDFTPAELGEVSLPPNLTLKRGELTVRFETPAQICESMLVLMRIIESVGFWRDYVPEAQVSSLPTDEAREDYRRLIAELDHA